MSDANSGEVRCRERQLPQRGQGRASSELLSGGAPVDHQVIDLADSCNPRGSIEIDWFMRPEDDDPNELAPFSKADKAELDGWIQQGPVEPEPAVVHEGAHAVGWPDS